MRSFINRRSGLELDMLSLDAGETGWASHEVAIKLVVSLQRGWVEAIDPQGVVHTPRRLAVTLIALRKPSLRLCFSNHRNPGHAGHLLGRGY